METVTSAQIAAGHLPWLEILAFLCTWAGGVLVNYVNKTAREGLDWKEYWTRNPLSTIASLVVSFGLCVSLLLQGETNHLTYFSVAFMAENLINSRGQGDGTKLFGKTKQQAAEAQADAEPVSEDTSAPASTSTTNKS